MGYRCFIALPLAAIVVLSCGPSLRRTHQSDNAFARCFDMDYNPGARRKHKIDCWNKWLEKHVFNQPDDKTAYAKLRLDELAKGISIPGPPGEPGSFHRRQKPERGTVEIEEETEKKEGPKPGAATEPTGDSNPEEPTRIEPEKGPVEPPENPPVAVETEKCEQRCKDNHTACTTDCGEDALPESKCTKSCIVLYTNCVHKCLK